MVRRILSVGDDFTLDPGTKVADANLPARLGATVLADSFTASSNTLAAALGTQWAAVNEVPNPSLNADASGWMTSTPGSGTIQTARVPGAGAGGSAGWVTTWTSASTTATGINTGPYIGPTSNTAARTPTTAGQAWSGGITVKSSVAADVFPLVNFYQNGTTLVAITGSVVSLTPGNPVEISVLNAVAPAGTTHVAVTLRVNTAAQMGANGVLTVSRAHLNKGTTLLPYADGDTSPARWSGTRGASATEGLAKTITSTITETISAGAAQSSIINALGAGQLVNYVPNPSLTVDATGWTAGYGTGGAGTATRVPGEGAKGSAGYVVQWTTASSQSGAAAGPSLGPTAATVRTPVTPGQVWTGSIYVKSPVTVSLGAAVNWYNSAGTFLGRTLNGSEVIPANTERRIYARACVAIAGAAFAAVEVRLDGAAQMGTSKITLSRAALTPGYQVSPYRDGSFPDAKWDGTPGASTSTARILGKSGFAIGYGDSHMQLAHGGGKPFPEHLAAILGIEVLNAGRGGETSTGIAIRQGGLDLFGTFASNQIPASGSASVTVTPTTTYRNDASYTFYGEFAGIPGTLTRAAGGAWTFTRTVAGSVTTCPPETRFLAYTATDNAQLTILEGGNNLPAQADVLRDFAAMVNRVRDFGGRFLIVSLYNDAASGTAGYNTTKAINDALKAEYGPAFVDLRSYIIAYGLTLAGITPTAGDTTAIAEDRIPPSLMADSIHLNDAGRAVVANRLAEIIRSKNLLN